MAVIYRLLDLASALETRFAIETLGGVFLTFIIAGFAITMAIPSACIGRWGRRS